MGYSQSGYVRCSDLAVSFVVWAPYLLPQVLGLDGIWRTFSERWNTCNLKPGPSLYP